MLSTHPLSRSFPAPAHARARLRLAPALLTGGAVIALGDFIGCLAFWSPHGVTALRVLQGVAAGLLGADAYHAGVPAAVLGALLQWGIGAAFVLAYAGVARHAPQLLQRPRHGIAYGLLLYLLMNRVVVPLSAFPQPAQPDPAWMLAGIPMFAGFGLVAALFARSALPARA